jgi:hypothetical protein
VLRGAEHLPLLEGDLARRGAIHCLASFPPPVDPSG